MSYRKPYQQPLPATWWLRSGYFRKYMVRECSGLFIVLYSMNLLCGLAALAKGAEAWDYWLNWQQTSLALVLHLAVLVMVIFHAVTWFSLAPKMMRIKVGNRHLTERTLELALCGLWLVVSLAVTVFFFWQE